MKQESIENKFNVWDSSDISDNCELGQLWSGCFVFFILLFLILQHDALHKVLITVLIEVVVSYFYLVFLQHRGLQ